MSQNTNDAVDSNRQAALDDLHAEVEANNMAGYWVVDTSANHDEDRQVMDTNKAIPFLWKYDDSIEPLLQKSAELISTDTSDRRSLVMVNPGLAPRRATTTTLYTAYRLNDPKDVMPAHRHSPNAVRLGLSGDQNFTGVEGENITFGRGDVVLTPHDTWHNHGNFGDEAAVNLSVLDLPLAEILNSIYFEHDYTEENQGEKVRMAEQSERFMAQYSQNIYGQGGFMPRFVSHNRGTGNASPMYVYRWAMMLEMLERFKDWDADPYEGIMIEYVDPTTGAPIYKTMTFFVKMLRPGERTLPMKQTASLVCTPMQGIGYSIVEGEKFEWGINDTLAIPGGHWCEHVNTSETEYSIMFIGSDEPTLKTLSFYRKFGKTDTGEVVRLA